MAVGGTVAAFQANPIDHQRVILNLEPMLSRDVALAFFDDFVDELYDEAALVTDEVIVVPPTVQLEQRLTALEMSPANQTSIFELRQHPVHGRQADLLAGVQQLLVHVLCTQMALFVVLQDGQDLDPGQGDLQAGLFDLLILHPLDSSSVNLASLLR